jgi:hypothetical protein
MAREGKYDFQVEQIPGDEPVILFRAQDITTPALLASYNLLCQAVGSPRHHVEHIEALRTRFLNWQARNADKVKAPD